MNYELPGYTLKEIVFTNACTKIQRAVRHEDNCCVIIKSFATNFPSARQHQRFLLSYDLLTKFQHPNIAKVLDYLEQDGLPVIVLEDTQSIALRQYAQQFSEQRFPVETLLNIAIQLADALNVIHQAGVSHQDLHPGNLLINARTGNVQINDFGLASLLSGEPATLASSEQTGSMTRSVDYRRDFYTLGVTLYELLSGQRSFSAQNAKVPARLRTWRNELPLMLSSIIDKLLNQAAEQCYQSAFGLKKDLEKCLLMFKTPPAMVEYPLGKAESATALFAGLSHSIINYFVMGLPLEKLSLRLEQLQVLMHKYQIKVSAARYYAYLLEGLSVAGGSNKQGPNPFEKSNFPPAEWTLIQSCMLKSFIEHLQIQWFFWSDQLDQAWQSVKLAEPSLALMSGLITPLEHRFLAALLACQKYPLAAEKEQEGFCVYIDLSMEELETLTKLCPENFEHKLLLLKAEQSRAMNADMSLVLSLYEQAIKRTKEGGYIQYQAFVYERCADYWSVQGFETAAKRYVQQAIYAYQQWGCALKCSGLQKKYAGLLLKEQSLINSKSAPDKASDERVLNRHLEAPSLNAFGQPITLTGKRFAALMQAVQEISSELNIRKLMIKTLRLLQENISVETAALVMNGHHGLVVEARITGSGAPTVAEKLQTCSNLPIAVINYVFQSGATFNLSQLNDVADADTSFIQTEPYIKHFQPKAMLCLPVISRGKVIGVLYLDCCAYPHEFSENHLRMAEMLLSQSIISFENARLFGKSERLNKTLEKKIDKRTQALEASSFELQTINDELAVFSYAVSHDLSAPLRRIKGFSEILLEDYIASLDKPGISLLRRIIDSSNKMTELIKGLLELSRVQNAEIDLKAVNLVVMAQSISRALNKEKISQNKAAKPVLFKCAEFVVIPGDERMFNSVMENLLNNAWKYSSKVDQAEVEFGVKRLKGTTVYFVKDNGAGFDMKHANKLFVSFKRLHLEHESSGAGVGLDTVKRIINKHSGKIWAVSELGKGATFYFTLWTEDI